MKSTKYLYGIKLDVLEKMKYFDALHYKLNSARRLYKELYDRIYLKGENNQDLLTRIFYVTKAIKHTEELLNEQEEWIEE